MEELRSTNQQRQARKWKIKLSKVGSRIIPRSVLPQCATCQALHGKEIIHQEYFFDWRLFTFFDTLVCAPMKYWEIIADNLSEAGWSWGCISAIESNGRTIWIVDAHRGDGKRFVVRAGES
jgi:hypothetical protein